MRNIMTFCMVATSIFLWSASAVRADGGAQILFDQGHNQRFLIEKNGELHLSGLAAIIGSQGLVVVSTQQPLSDAVLKSSTALVISGPFEELRPEEVDAVVRFIERGGRLAAMLHIGPPLASLLKRLDLDYSNAVLHERRNVIDTDNNFRLTDLSASRFFTGLTSASLWILFIHAKESAPLGLCKLLFGVPTLAGTGTA